MILLMILFVSFFQVVLYLLLDRTTVKKLKVFVLLLLLACHLFVFPKLFYPKLPPGAVCGMPIVGVILAFWIFGSLITTLTHVAYLFVTRKKMKFKSP